MTTSCESSSRLKQDGISECNKDEARSLTSVIYIIQMVKYRCFAIACLEILRVI